MKRIKIEMVRMNITKGEAEFEKVIDLTESYFFKCWEVYRGKKLENNELVDGIIKVVLSEDNGLNELKEGITYNDNKYIEINTTTAGMKLQETNEIDEKFRVESIFIKEEHKDFIKEFEDSLSAGIISELEKNKSEICINKMVTSKKALAMTKSDFVEGMPNICFVDEFKYKYRSNYSFLNKNNEIISDEIMVDFVLNDGGGLMTSEYAERIKKALDKDYNIEFAIIRGYHGLAIKGVLLTFDFRYYMKSQYKGDTDTFKKIGDKYYLKDYFGNWRNLDRIDCIMNKSQAKYLGEWKSKVPEGTRWEEIIYPIYKDSKYNGVNKGIYISKVNKNPKSIKGKIMLNYQVIQNLNISAQELIEIAKETIEEFKNVIGLEDVNYVKLALGDWLTDVTEKATITNKLDLVIDRFGDETLKWKYIRSMLKKQLMKRINKLSGGKIEVDGDICVGCCDPISYCNYLISGDRGKNGLEEGQFYQGGYEGKRLSYRNPIAYYAEITEIDLVKHKLLEGYSPEILFVNAFDDFLFIKSGADLDGDLFGVVNNETLINSIIKEEAPFINLDDSKAEKNEFTRKQMYEDLWASSGNLIGEIAIKNSRLCAEVTSYKTLVFKNNEVESYTAYKNKWMLDENKAKTFYEYKKKFNYYLRRRDYENDMLGYDEAATWEEYNEYIENNQYKEYKAKITKEFKEHLEKEEIKFIREFSDQEQRKVRESIFKKYKNDFFKILLASQIAIDMPKKLVGIPDWLEDDLKDYSKLYKPRFMHNLGKCSCNGKGDIRECKDIINRVSNNVMDEYCYYIYKELIKPLHELIDDGTKPNKSFLGTILGTDGGVINESLVSIYKENSKLRKENVGNTLELNRIDIDTKEKVDSLGDISVEDISKTLRSINASISFCFKFIWDKYLLPNLLKMDSKTDSLIRDIEGEYKWGGYRYKVEKKDKEIDIVTNEEEQLKRKVKDGSITKIRIGQLTHIKVEEECEVKIEGNKVFYNDEELGTIFKDFVGQVEDGIYTAKLDWTTKNNKEYEKAKSMSMYI